MGYYTLTHLFLPLLCRKLACWVHLSTYCSNILLSVHLDQLQMFVYFFFQMSVHSVELSPQHNSSVPFSPDDEDVYSIELSPQHNDSVPTSPVNQDVSYLYIFRGLEGSTDLSHYISVLCLCVILNSLAKHNQCQDYWLKQVRTYGPTLCP